MVNRVGIRLTRTRDDGSTEELHGVYAGATVYMQNGRGWRSILNVATFGGRANVTTSLAEVASAGRVPADRV